MASSNSAPPGSGSPPKPWERTGAASGPAPFKPPTPGSTSDVVEASGTAKPGEVITAANRTLAPINNVNSIAQSVPSRPWQQGYGNTYGGPASNMYSSYGGFGSPYSSGLYGNSMNSSYGGGYGGSYGGYGGSYGGMYGGSGMYGGGSGMYGGSMYNSGFGGPLGGNSMGMGGPYGNQDPNNPFGPASQPPGFWMSFLRVMHGVVNFFGRIAVLVDQNTQAFHMFISALLQLFDRSGVLYGELARFILRVLGIRTKPRKGNVQGPGDVPSLEGPKAAGNSWENVWGSDANGN